MNTQDTAKIESKQPYKYGDIQKLLREIGQWHEKYRDAHVGATADGKDPITMVKDYVDAILTTAIEEAYERGRLAEIEANATADITIAQDKAEQIRAEARREERKDLVEWMCNTKGVYSAHDVRMSFISYINTLNNREDI